MLKYRNMQKIKSRGKVLEYSLLLRLWKIVAGRIYREKRGSLTQPHVLKKKLEGLNANRLFRKPQVQGPGKKIGKQQCDSLRK